MTNSMANENPFHEVPIEILQEIACYLSNKDISNFTSVCTSFARRILPAESPIWRKRFEDLYEVDPSRTSDELKNGYRIRAIVLPHRNVSFKDGETRKETLWLEVLLTMLLETYVSRPPGLSKNLDRISEVMSNVDFLRRPHSGYTKRGAFPPSDRFYVLQLCLTFLALDIEKGFYSLRNDYEIEKVYSFKEALTIPIVSISKPDLRRILHIRNFWQRHLVNETEDTFYKAYRTLTELDRPKPWNRRLDAMFELRSTWLGFQSCVHPFPTTLADLQVFETCADMSGHLHEEPPMTLEFVPDSNEGNWPLCFNSIIPIEGTDKSSRLYFRGIQEYRPPKDLDDLTFLIRGVVEPIPEPQAGVPGWMRICFVIYDPNREYLHLLPSDGGNSTGRSDADEFGRDPVSSRLPNEQWPPIALEDFTWLYGYEGVIIPGGRIMLGRSMDMKEVNHQRCDRGPFIFWDV